MAGTQRNWQPIVTAATVISCISFTALAFLLFGCDSDSAGRNAPISRTTTQRVDLEFRGKRVPALWTTTSEEGFTQQSAVLVYLNQACEASLVTDSTKRGVSEVRLEGAGQAIAVVGRPLILAFGRDGAFVSSETMNSTVKTEAEIEEWSQRVLSSLEPFLFDRLSASRLTEPEMLD